MAVVRPRSTPPYATIIFVFLWVISTGLAIWLGVKKGEAEKQTDNFRQQTAAADKRANDATSAQNRLREAIESNAAAKTSDEVVADAVSAREKAGFANESLLTILGNLNSQVNDPKSNWWGNCKRRTRNLTTNSKPAFRPTAALAAANQSLNQEKANAAKAEAEAAQERADKVALLAQKEGDLTKFKDTSEQDPPRKHPGQIQALKTDNASKDAQIVQLRQDLAAKRAGNNNLAIKPAGTIIRARPAPMNATSASAAPTASRWAVALLRP